jgi:putative aldouronate transport system permease protein
MEIVQQTRESRPAVADLVGARPLPTSAARDRRRAWRGLWRDRWMYLLILPGLLYYVVFQYLPLLGNAIAFMDYSPFLGVRGSTWVGLENFRALLTDPDFGIALRNTLVISLLQLVFFFPAPIILALVLNSILSEPVKRFIQSVVYLPHFLSWVIIVALWQQVLGGDGLVNHLLRDGGFGTVNVMGNPDLFQPLVVLQLMWKETGWGTIIFLAALTKIDVSLYEAAVVDGAGPRRRLWDITLPGIMGVVVLLLVIRLGYVLSTGFEQIFLQRNAVGAEASEVLDTFVYFRGVQGGDWGFSAAVDLVKGLVGMALVLTANRVARRLTGEGVF